MGVPFIRPVRSVILSRFGSKERNFALHFSNLKIRKQLPSIGVPL